MSIEETRIQGIIWEFVHDGTNAEPLSGSISYQTAEVAFHPTFDSGSVSYQTSEVAFHPYF